MKHYSEQRGFLMIWFLAIMGITSCILMAFLEGTAGISKLTSSMDELDFVQSVDDQIEEVLWKVFSESLIEREIDKMICSRFEKSLNPMLEPHIAIYNPNMKEEKVSSEEYIRYILEVTVVNRKTKKSYFRRHAINLKKLPSTKFNFICSSVFSPDSTSMPLEVKGDAIVPGVFANGLGSSLEFENLFCKFVLGGLETAGQIRVKKRLEVSHKLAFRYGDNTYHNFVRGDRSTPFHSKSGERENQTVRILFDGEAISKSPPGISLVNFNQGPLRVQIDLGQCSCGTVLHIQCTTQVAEEIGVLVKGTPLNNPYAPKCIITNGRIWLMGSHLGIPLIIASTNGGWTFSDDTWFEGLGSPSPLRQDWKGYLASPAHSTVFSSPQSMESTGHLTLFGTLMIGSKITGNLGLVTIEKSADVDSKLRPYSDCLAMIESIEHISK